MSSRKRRIIIGLALLLAIALPLAYLYFVSTNEALRHAEAFIFRRMTVAQLAEQGQYRFHYVTNRVLADPDAPLDGRFEAARSEQLSFGYFDAQIEASLGLGMLINPTEWLQNEEIRLLSVNAMARERMIDELRETVARSPHRALLLVLHGYREAFESALRKTAFLGHVLDVDAPVLVFDWPGNQGSSLRGYRRAHRVASESGAEFARLVSELIAEVEPGQLWILANSMGAQVVVKGMGRLYQTPELADAEPEIDHIVLTAPDVDSEEFNQRFRGELAAVSEQLTVYVSSNDRALLASRLLNRGARLGKSTLGPEQLDEASRVLDLTRDGDDLVSLVDVTPVNRTRNFHNFSLETPEFFDDLYLRLTNPEMPNSRPVYHVRTPAGGVYSVLTRGR